MADHPRTTDERAPRRAGDGFERYPARAADTEADLLPQIRVRWSPVRFAPDRPVSRNDLRAILEAARWAPSCYGDEPWAFIVAASDDAHRKALEACLSEGNAWARRAPILLAGLARTRFRKKDRPNRWGRHDLGLATAMLMIEATHRGLVTHAMGGFDRERLREVFDVPDDHEPMWVMAVGHHDAELDDETLAERERKPRRRRPLEAFVFRGPFGAEPGV